MTATKIPKLNRVEKNSIQEKSLGGVMGKSGKEQRSESDWEG
jgi:hypothetical protein